MSEIQMSSWKSWFSQRSTINRRHLGQFENETFISSRSLRPALDEGPNPRRTTQFLALGFVAFLAFLQLLPATHLRDSSHPFTKWVPLQTNLSSSSNESRASKNEDSRSTKAHGEEDGIVHIVSWMDCLDLRMLAVLANSTLSSSRHPELVYFHFFTPEGHDDKISYYKLKVLFPHSNLDVLGQTEVKEAIVTAYSSGKYAAPMTDVIAPFVIPIVHPSLSKFIYVSPNVIMKGRVEELRGVNLRNYAIGIAEDCSKRLSTYVSTDVMDAIQRSASKPWVSATPYAKNACMPELGLVLIDATKMEKDLVESILWWSRVLNSSERSNPNPAIALAVYNKHLKLPTSWRLSNFTSSEINNGSLVLQYGGPTNVCSAFNSGNIELSDIWKMYLPPTSDRILGS